MKNKLFLVSSIFLLVLAGCAEKHIQTIKSSPENEAICWNFISNYASEPQMLDSLLDAQISAYQEQVEQLLVSGKESVKMVEQSQAQIVDEAPIPPAILEGVTLRMKQDLALVEPIAETLARNICWQEATSEHLESLSLQPLNRLTRIKGMMFELAATITLYDMYFNVIAIINEVDRLRTFANKGDSGYGIEKNRVEEITDRFADLDNLTTVRANIQKYDSLRSEVEQYKKQDDILAYLDILIRSSSSYRKFAKIPASTLLTHKRSARSHVLRDNLNEMNSLVVGNISETFGNIVGKVEERKGKLYQNEELKRYLQDRLQAGDVLLEKTPFRHTDRFIPGFWGHAAIWAGSEAELKELEIWEHQSVLRHHEQIMNGQLVAEALREGTVLNTLGHFMNVDDLVILRRHNLSKKDKGEVLVRTFRQLGKAYDFNFNVETTDRIVCSQLVYLAYPDIPWPTEYIAGRYTISPDNIAARTANGDLFEIIVLIRDGVIISENKEYVMSSLIHDEG